MITRFGARLPHTPRRNEPRNQSGLFRSDMSERALLAFKRFSANMRRVNSLTTLALSNEGQFKPIGLWKYDGISADLFRAIVVLLHATVEDLVRSHVKNPGSFTFSGANDIFKHMTNSGYNTSSLEHLRKPLQQFALRRHRIVHYGDLRESSDDVEPWGMADAWSLTQWQLAISAFLYKFLEVVTEPTELFTFRYNAACKALDENVKLGHDLANIGKRIPKPLTADNAHELQAALSELIERLNAITRLLEKMSA